MGIAEKFKRLFSKTRDEIKAAKGKKHKDKIYYSRVEFPDRASAEAAYYEAVKRLFDINAWSSIPVLAKTTFILCDENGNRVNDTMPKEGYYIKILLPGPVPENWVVITSVKEDNFAAEFVTSPSPDPTNKYTSDMVTKHFFRSEASSTFRVSLNKKVLTGYEIGRNEAINNRLPESGSRAAINTTIAEVGWAGFQHYQWKNLTDYFIGKK